MGMEAQPGPASPRHKTSLNRNLDKLIIFIEIILIILSLTIHRHRFPSSDVSNGHSLCHLVGFILTCLPYICQGSCLLHYNCGYINLGISIKQFLIKSLLQRWHFNFVYLSYCHILIIYLSYTYLIIYLSYCQNYHGSKTKGEGNYIFNTYVLIWSITFLLDDFY